MPGLSLFTNFDRVNREICRVIDPLEAISVPRQAFLPTWRQLVLPVHLVLLMAGTVTLVVYEMIRVTGSQVDTIHYIVTNLWHAGAAALFFTLTAAGISSGRDIQGYKTCCPQAAPMAFQVP